MLQACSTSRPGIARQYAEPVDPPCVKELVKADGKSLGFFDFRECQAAEIGVAWVKEKRLRMKYHKQVDILNAKP